MSETRMLANHTSYPSPARPVQTQTWRDLRAGPSEAQPRIASWHSVALAIATLLHLDEQTLVARTKYYSILTRMVQVVLLFLIITELN